MIHSMCCEYIFKNNAIFTYRILPKCISDYIMYILYNAFVSVSLLIPLTKILKFLGVCFPIYIYIFKPPFSTDQAVTKDECVC